MDNPTPALSTLLGPNPDVDCGLRPGIIVRNDMHQLAKAALAFLARIGLIRT